MENKKILHSAEQKYSYQLDLQRSQNGISLDYNLDYGKNSYWAVPFAHQSENEMPFQVQELGYTIAHEDYYVVRENYDSYMVTYMISGGVDVTYNGIKENVPAGFCSWIDCRKKHTFRLSEGVHKMEAFFIHFKGKGAETYYNQFLQQNFGFCFDVKKDSFIPLHFHRLIQLYQQNGYDDMWEFASSTYASLLCFDLLKLLQQKVNATIPAYIKDMKQYIDEHYYEKILLEDLSSRSGYSRTYFLKQYRKYMGTTPNEYLNSVRMEKAKTLLLTTDYPVREIAEEVGIPDVSYFIRVFRNTESSTPLEYRKLFRRP